MSPVLLFLLRIPYYVLGALVAATALVVNIGVFLRYVLNAPTGFYDEVSRILLLWIVFVGMAVAIDRGSHAALQVIDRWLTEDQIKRLARGVNIVVIFFCLFMMWYGGMAAQMAFKQVFTMTGLSVGWQYVAAPVGAALTIVYAVKQLLGYEEPAYAGFHGDVAHKE